MIGTLIKQEVNFLNDSQYVPVLNKVVDMGNSIDFVFTIQDKIVTISHPDTFVLQDEDVMPYINLPRDKCLTSLARIIKQALKDEDEFHPVITPVIKDKVLDVVHSFMRPDMLYLINSDFLLTYYSPIIAYNIAYSLVSKLKEKHTNVPNDLEVSLVQPEQFYDPAIVLDRINNNILQNTENTGVIV